MSPVRIIVLIVALLAAIGAAFLVRSAASKPAPQAAAAPPPAVETVPVLVVKSAKTVGDKLTEADLGWADMAAKSVNSEDFFLKTKNAKALEETVGAVVRVPMVRNEPITKFKAVLPGDRGMMAAILREGMRAASISISEDTAAAGFITPGDLVDVVLTRTLSIKRGEDSSEEVRSDIVLEAVKVLAIDQNPQPGEAGDKPKTVAGSVATLELTPRDAEQLALADELGDISLILRPVSDDKYIRVVSQQRKNARALEQGVQEKIDSIRVHSYGSVEESRVTGKGKGIF